MSNKQVPYLCRRVPKSDIARPFPNPTFEWAAEYINRQLAVLPVPYLSKRPTIKRWPTVVMAHDKLAEYFSQAPLNIGVLLGERSGGLVDVDVDSPQAVTLADFFLPKTSSIFGRRGKPRSHRLYRCNDAVYEKFVCPTVGENSSTHSTIVEVRTAETGKGIQTIFPPSVHESGESIEWVHDGTPAEIETTELSSAVARLAAASLLATCWRAGKRQDLTMAIAGTLLRHGFDLAQTIHFVGAVCVASLDTETEKRLQAVKDCAHALREGKNVFGVPKLAALTDRRIADAICKWLRLQSLGAVATNPGPPSPDRIKLVCMKDVEAREVQWLWNPFIPIGEFTIVEGIEGIGKSWFCCALACAVAGGTSLPFHEGSVMQPGNVLIMSAEDSLSHTLRPRLESMNADLSRIFACEEVFSLNNTEDLLWFASKLDEYQPKLVILDPMFSFTEGKDLNTESASRPLARKLIALEQGYGCAVIGVRHVGKSKGQGDPRNAGLGSISWRASARSVLLVGEDPGSGERAVCQTKMNLAEMSAISVGYEIVAGKFLFKGSPSALTKERMLSQVRDPDATSEQADAIEFLKGALAAGERPSKDVERESRELGITSYSLRKAKTTLRVQNFKKGGNYGGDQRWFIRLPGPAEVVDIRRFQHLQQHDASKGNNTNVSTEDVDEPVRHNLQSDESTSSDRTRALCSCGEHGVLGRSCRNCGEVVAPE